MLRYLPTVYSLSKPPSLLTSYETGSNKNGRDADWKSGLAIKGWPRKHKSLGSVLVIFLGKDAEGKGAPERDKVILKHL